MTQSELAEGLGLESHSHIAKLEHGVAPSLSVVVRIADQFSVATDYLLRDTITVDDFARFSLEKAAETTTRTGALSFGDKLRALRLRQEQSQIELANQLGLSSGAYISNLEAGRKLPSLEVVIRIADLFGVTTDALLRDEMLIPAEGTT